MRIRRLEWVGVASLLASLGGAAGCARGPDVSSGLALQRVVIYRNGVAYYERAGHVDEAEVTFKVRNEKVGDFLATLAVIEAGGSSVRSASFPVEIEDEEEDEDEEPEPAPLPAERYSIPIIPPPPTPPPPKEKKKNKLATVTLTLDGAEHDLIVGYVAETPVWRPSYRLVIHKQGKPGGGADLQAWGIVQNQSGEDWKGIKLSLVAGAPLAFQATLEKPVIPERPVVTDRGEVIAAVPVGETTLAEAPPGAAAPGPPPPPPMEPEPEPDEDAWAGDEAEEAGGEGYYGPMGGGRAARAPMPKSAPSAADRSNLARRYKAGVQAESRLESAPVSGPSMPRNVNALAAVAMEAGTTRYDLPFPVDIPDKSATMVLLMAKEVPGESIFLFAPDGGVPESRAHPFRVARFTNNTKGLIERGPIAVFESNAFLGQGMVDPLPPGATATVPFALERSLGVEVNRTEREEGARLAKIEAGEIEIERDYVTHTKYTLKSGSDTDAKTLVKHRRIPGTRLHEPPKGTEDNVGTRTALVPIMVPKHGKALLDVDERRVYPRRVDWMSELADLAVKAYMADARADAKVVSALKAAWEIRDKRRKVADERAKLDAEKRQLDYQGSELRRNLRAIEKNQSAGDLRKDLTDRLAGVSSRIDEITKRTIVLDMQENELAVRFRDIINGIRMLKPLPVP